MLLPTRAEQVYEDVWLPMQRALGTNLELLIWLDMVLRGDDKVKESEVYRAQADRLKTVEEDEARIAEEITEFSRRSAHLLLLLQPENEKDPEVRQALRRLSEWGGQAAYPTAMLLLDRREKGQLDSADVARALLIVESFLVRRMIAGVPTNNINRILNAVPRELAKTNAVAEGLREYLSGTRRFWPGDAEIREAIRSKPFYWSGRGPQRSYVLRRLEESYEAPEPVDWARAKTTVEHLMPQKLTDAWRADLSAEAEAAGLTVSELHDSLVHTLGNLTLTALNGPLGNHPFDRKKEILHAGALAMNREVIEAPRWGAAEIRARADRLADRVLRIWPGPSRAESAARSRDWTRLHQAMAMVPAGAWTTYGDLAELIGSHPVPVGVHLANEHVPNAWRALTADGRPSKQFRWQSERTESQQQVLESEGVTFDGSGHASPEQRLSAAELARLIGLDVPDETSAPMLEVSSQELFDRFLGQLSEAQGEETAVWVSELLVSWNRLGGWLNFGTADETSCFPMLGAPGRQIWPIAIYPRTGSVEVVFQHLSRRPPFDDLSLRRELLDRLNQIDGINLPAAKLSMRPSFPITALGSQSAVAAAGEVLEWFVSTCAAQSDEWQPTSRDAP